MKENYFIGNREFYRKIIIISLPIIIQNLFTNFVGLLDNIMVGRLGTDQMNGVSIVNQLMFVYNLFIWGAVSGAGIFTAQYFGKGDDEGVRNTFRAKIIYVESITIIAFIVFYIKGNALVSLFLHETNSVGNAEETLNIAHRYLMWMLVGLIPLSVSFIYSNTLRDMGQTAVPMKAGVSAVLVNLVLNYILIFGHFGAPAMGTDGAAIATVISRFIEMIINVTWTHTYKEQNRFISGAFRTLKIPANLSKQIVAKGAPLALNEALWSLGITALTQSYSLRGLSVIAALNIAVTMSNLFNVFFFAIGESISIIVGQLLGAEKFDEAKTTARKMLFMSVSFCIVLGIIMSLCRNIFPSIYKTEQDVKLLASKLILISSCFMPIQACCHGCYFTLRSGGKTMITFLFDNVFVWGVCVTTAFTLTRFTNLEIVPIYFIVTALDILKASIGIFLVKKGIWINNIVME